MGDGRRETKELSRENLPEMRNDVYRLPSPVSRLWR
jgi:hypothetical protein